MNPEEIDFLTERQFEILLLIKDGLTNDVIARRLGISKNTVACHIQRMFLRLRTPNRAAAVALYYRRFPSC